MGIETIVNVNTSDVGVMMAAIINVTTMACLLNLRNKLLLINPNFASNHAMIGISNRMPIMAHNMKKVSM